MKRLLFPLLTLALLGFCLASPVPAYAAVTYTTCPSFSDFATGVMTDGDITFDIDSDCTIAFSSVLNLNSTVSITNLAYGTHTVTFEAPGVGRHFHVPAGGDLSLDGITLNNSNSVWGVGGIHNEGILTVTNSILSGNRSGAGYGGGGIYNEGALTLTSSTLIGNYAGTYGGGVYNIGDLTMTGSTLSNNWASIGGGIGNGNGSTVSVTGSTLSDNTSNTDGGGIYNNGTMFVTNSTLSGNTASNYRRGGGIYNNGTLSVASCTLSDNSAYNVGGIYNTRTLTVTDSIIAASTGVNCFNSSPGSLTAVGDNFADDATCTNFTNSTNLLLGSLADNGGSTHTIALGLGSDAIDAATTSTLNRDQRGYERPAGAANDSGAFEYGAVLPEPEPEPFCLIDSHTDGRLNAADGCAPIAVYADGASGLEIYTAVAPDYSKGAFLAAAGEAAVNAGLAAAESSGVQELIARGGGADVYALPDGQVKVELAGVYGAEFAASLLAGGDPLPGLVLAAPITLPETLPATGGAMHDMTGWAVFIALVTGVAAYFTLKRD